MIKKILFSTGFKLSRFCLYHQMEGAVSTTSSKGLRMFDIAANLADETFQGIYYDKKVHEADVDSVIQRAASVGCDRLLIVGGYIEDAIRSHEIASKSSKFYCTVGVHPCRAN